MLKIDGNLEGETQAAGQTEYIEVEKTFFLGNLKPETLQLNVVKNNLQVCKVKICYDIFMMILIEIFKRYTQDFLYHFLITN